MITRAHTHGRAVYPRVTGGNYLTRPSPKNAYTILKPTYFRLASHRTQRYGSSFSLSLSRTLAASRDGDGATLTVPGLVTLSALGRSFTLPVGGGAVAVTVAAVEARHTHTLLHMMRGGDGRLLSRVTAISNMAAASISRRRGCFAFFLVCLLRAPGARYRSRYEQSRAIQISRRCTRNFRDLYRRPSQYII